MFVRISMRAGFGRLLQHEFIKHGAGTIAEIFPSA